MLPPGRNAKQHIYPYTMEIEDAYGEVMTLSKSLESGDVLQISGGSYNDDGDLTSFSVSGNFHNTFKQNAIDRLARLKGMAYRSEQEDQSLLAIVGHPQIEMRGRIQNLQSPQWTSTPHPILFSYSFDFVRDSAKRQPNVFRPPSEVVLEEGKDYVVFEIPNAALADLKELAYAFYGKNNSDGRKIREIIKLNQFTITQVRALTSGSMLKLPLK